MYARHRRALDAQAALVLALERGEARPRFVELHLEPGDRVEQRVERRLDLAELRAIRLVRDEEAVRKAGVHASQP